MYSKFLSNIFFIARTYFIDFLYISQFYTVSSENLQRYYFDTAHILHVNKTKQKYLANQLKLQGDRYTCKKYNLITYEAKNNCSKI